MRTLCPLLVAFMLAGIGCAQAPVEQPSTTQPTPDGSSADPQRFDGVWQLQRGHGPEGSLKVVDGWKPIAVIDGENLGGFSGCNQYGARFTAEADSIDITVLGANQAGCPRDTPKIEATFFAALGDVTRGSRTGNALKLSGPNSSLSFRELPRPPVDEIVGTKWHLVRLRPDQGDEVNRRADAHLELRPDGTFRGTTGCRRLRGTWIDADYQILFTRMGAHGGCEKELKEQDGFVINVLGDGFFTTVQGNRLVVGTAQGREGLVYRRS